VEGGALNAYKFLRPGAIGPFSGIAWTTEWIAAEDGVSACERRYLPIWIWEELWEIELAGDVETRGHKLRAPRARLTQRVEGWSADMAKSFARACARRATLHAAGPLRGAGQEDAAAVFAEALDLEHVRALTSELWDVLPEDVQKPVGMASDGCIRALVATASDDHYIAAHGGAVSAYIAAMTAQRVGGPEQATAERAWQADWLTRELRLV
jgi:hypothetical protein